MQEPQESHQDPASLELRFIRNISHRSNPRPSRPERCAAS